MVRRLVMANPRHPAIPKVSETVFDRYIWGVQIPNLRCLDVEPGQFGTID